MSLATNVTNLATRVATEIKSVRTLLNGNAADNSALLTTAKGNLVAAINELYTAVQSATGINDNVTASSSTWSSTKIAAQILALISDTASDGTHTWSASKIGSYVTAQIASAIAGLPPLDDTKTDTSHVWSSSKTQSTITAAINALVNGAPAALDTLKELADGLAADQSSVGTITTALGKRVAVDQAQTFTSTEQAQGRANIGAAASTDLGDPTTDYVAVFNAGLV
jgi:hypothetical protein